MPKKISIYGLVGKAIYSKKQKLGFVVQSVRYLDERWMLESSTSRFYIETLISCEYKLGKNLLIDILDLGID